ncbi:HAD superfamily hydrolase [Fusarium heterosporum]|uniref:HAD superfamily hydrolase n=1 Tax=Fusarium heterosporum TaxID=42747 RepID=A0A8H5SN76_FUSHE|nr:HAD superfamily hydrolase [Fusarium heterosporum]
MDLPKLDSQGSPVRFPDCCLSISGKLIQILADIFSNTTFSEETPTVLSIGSGSGILEALLLAHAPSQSLLNVEGVEVQQSSWKDPVNKYLPEQAIYTVRGTWDVISRLQDPDVTALMFVYPRQASLISEYMKAISEQDLNVRVIVWLGPMADWEVFESCFTTRDGNTQFIIGEKRQGAEAGLDEYELMVVLDSMLRRVVSIMASSSPKRFIPLKKGNHDLPTGTPSLHGVVFDMDGTLCEPQTYMFKEMKDALGISKTTDILEHVDTLPKAEQPEALEKIRNIERKAMKAQTPQPGLMTLMTYLDTNAIPKAICTRNFDVPVQNLIEKFLEGSRFHPIVTRDFHPPKPDPAGILHIAKDWGLKDESGEGDASGLIMVGDSIDDMTAGRKAGAATVLLVNDVNQALAEHAHTDLVITTLDELVDVLEHGFVGREIVSE